MYEDFSKVYDELMQEIDYSEWADYLFRITLNAARPIKKVLEFGCGTGNITLELAKRGFDVTAVDLSEEMLTVADEKVGAAGLDIRFFKGDMSNFRIDESFDAVFCCCDSVNYLPTLQDVENFIICAGEVLAPGGMLIFDMNTSEKFKNVIGDNTFVYNFDNVFCVWENRPDAEAKKVTYDLSFFVKRDDGLYERFEETQAQYSYPVEDVFKMLKAPAFKNVKIYDFGTFLAGGVLNDRVQFVAEKR
ncbi:class I SAM-dependent methyltransferase [Pseudoramibacter faecis]|uniref:class I SAM-dependent DNA methyltransferase n=1 Tax=Pseudoramibacter faecis TaxID=3108534 RepID=UPI002E762AC2|nr:class I SAM-dependent methyltransferase [Pseudoramibacter sp. HA2172]